MRNTHERNTAKWIMIYIVSYIRGYLVRAINERIKPWAIHLEHKLPICRQGTDRINQRDYPAICYAWCRVATKVLLLFYAYRLTQSTLRLVAAHKYQHCRMNDRNARDIAMNYLCICAVKWPFRITSRIFCVTVLLRCSWEWMNRFQLSQTPAARMYLRWRPWCASIAAN